MQAGRVYSYERRRPEETTLYRVVQDNLETLYEAVEEGAVALSLPQFVKSELEGYLECGMLCRGFARLRCGECAETRLVAFSCKGRGFCPSCLGRKMSATALNLEEAVMPRAPLRQWVLTLPYPWRKRLGYDGKLLSALTRMFVRTVHAFYTERTGGESGAVCVVQRTQGDLRLNPHLHVVFVDGGYCEEEGGEVKFEGLGHLRTREVGEVLERAVVKMRKYLARRGLLQEREEPEEARGHAELCGSAASGEWAPAGPQWKKKDEKEGPRPLSFVAKTELVVEGALVAKKDGFTVHAATCVGADDAGGRERLLRYILRPPFAQERVQKTAEGLVRIALKKRWSDGTVAVEMDPLSLLCRLAASVPPPRFHMVRYSGVVASASKLRSRVVPKPPPKPPPDAKDAEHVHVGSRYIPWAELMMRTFKLDVLECPRCRGRMKLLAMVTELGEVRRFLDGLDVASALPERTPARGPPYWQSKALRRLAGAA